MSCISGFEFDIFISYSWNDNHAAGGAPGWVEAFHDELESWLKHRRGRLALSVWRDRQQTGNTVFDLAIENKIKSSALFFALNSRNFLKSEYCAKELALFQRYHGDRPLLGEQSRIFHILLNNIPHAQWPQGLRGTSGLPMYDAEEGELGDFTSPHDPRFVKQLRAIVDAVEKTLDAFPKAPTTAPPEKPAISVFIADVSDTLQPTRDRVLAELQQAGAQIITDIPPPMEALPHQQKVQETLAQARFAIHLLDAQPGRRIVDQKETTYPRRQIELSLDRTLGPSAGEHTAPSLIWVSNEIQYDAIADETQREFLQRLETGDRAGKHYEFVRCGVTELLELVQQKISAMQQRPGSNGAAASFLIDTYQSDQLHAFRLATMLAERAVEVEFNKESPDPVQSLLNFEQALRRVCNLILVCGSVREQWLHGRVMKAAKIAIEQSEIKAPVTLENIYLLLLPASKDRIARLNLPGVIKLETLDNTHAETIAPQVIDRLLNASRTGGRR